MQSQIWLPTKAAAQALGISTDTLKRKREICGGFLEAGRHWCAGPTSNSPLTWCVEECRKEIHERGMDVRGGSNAKQNHPAQNLHTSAKSFVLSKHEVNYILNCVFFVSHADRNRAGGLLQEREEILIKSIIAKFKVHEIMSRGAQVYCRLVSSHEAC